MAKKLFVGNLPQGCTNDDLRGLFQSVGEVDECDVLKNYGFVHMVTETESQEAVTQLDKTDFLGSIIQVQLSTSTVHKTTGVGNKGECFQCGKLGHFSRDCHLDGRGEGGRGRGRGGPRGGRGSRGSSNGRGGSYRGSEGGSRGGYRGGRGGRDRASVDHKDRDYYGEHSSRRPPPPDYYDRYYEDYYRRPPPYPYPAYSRDPYSRDPYRARSRSPPPARRPMTPPRYRRRGESPPPPPRDYYDYPPAGGDRYAEPRSHYPPPRSRYSPPPPRQTSAF